MSYNAANFKLQSILLEFRFFFLFLSHMCVAVMDTTTYLIIERIQFNLYYT